MQNALDKQRKDYLTLFYLHPSAAASVGGELSRVIYDIIQPIQRIKI